MNDDSESLAHFLTGIEAFNAADYFTAHEVWEIPWRFGPIAHRLFFQSLIQGAVALYHWRKGNEAGAARLLAAGQTKAIGYPPLYLGLDLPAFWQAVTQTLATPPHEPLDPDSLPKIVLQPPLTPS